VQYIGLRLKRALSRRSAATADVLSALDATGSSLFHAAAANGDADLMRFLLTRWVGTRSPASRSPFSPFRCCRSASGNLDGEDLSGRRTPLYVAASLQHRDAALLLLAHGASTKNVVFGRTVEDVLKEKLPSIDLSQIQV
jgi:ankyrin repeat protein